MMITASTLSGIVSVAAVQSCQSVPGSVANSLLANCNGTGDRYSFIRDMTGVARSPFLLSSFPPFFHPPSPRVISGICLRAFAGAEQRCQFDGIIPTAKRWLMSDVGPGDVANSAVDQPSIHLSFCRAIGMESGAKCHAIGLETAVDEIVARRCGEYCSSHDTRKS